MSTCVFKNRVTVKCFLIVVIASLLKTLYRSKFENYCLLECNAVKFQRKHAASILRVMVSASQIEAVPIYQIHGVTFQSQ